MIVPSYVHVMPNCTTAGIEEHAMPRPAGNASILRNSPKTKKEIEFVQRV